MSQDLIRSAPAAGRANEPSSASVRVVAPARARLAYLDNLKTLLIVGIIAAHALQGYAGFGSWTYQAVRETSISGATEIAMAILLSFGSLFTMGLMFLIAGLLSFDSARRKGAARFAKDRLIRLGVPFAVYTLLVWPATEYAMFHLLGHPTPYWDHDPILDNGPMWFVGVLLVFSLGYAAVVRWRPSTDASPSPLDARHLVWLALAVGASTFLVRLVFPIGSNQPGNLHLWQWPQILAAFGLGAVAARSGWLRPVAERLATRCGAVTLAVGALVGVSIVLAAVLGYEQDVFAGGWRLGALLAAMSEGALVVAGSIWALGWAQRHLDGTGSLRRALARSSYAAFMLQGPVLVALALVMRALDLPGDVKAFAVAGLGIVGSFAIGHLLVTRTPLRRTI